MAGVVPTVTDSVAVVPVTVKSAASTFATSSLNVTRQVRLSALVRDDDGLCRSIEVTVGAVLSSVCAQVGETDRVQRTRQQAASRPAAPSGPTRACFRFCASWGQPEGGRGVYVVVGVSVTSDPLGSWSARWREPWNTSGRPSQQCTRALIKSLGRNLRSLAVEVHAVVSHDDTPVVLAHDVMSASPRPIAVRRGTLTPWNPRASRRRTPDRGE